jgi:AcrR family transcriptional regulator
VLRERYERKRQLVVDAAARLFAEQGYQGTSVADLVEDTGLTAGGLYHYMGSKEQLLIQICDELMDPLIAATFEILNEEDRPLEQLRAIVRVWVAHVEHHLDHMRVFQQERSLLEHGPQWREVRLKRKRFEHILAEVIDNGVRRGEMWFRDERLALLALLGMVNYTPQWFQSGGRLTATEIADGYVDLLLGQAYER